MVNIINIENKNQILAAKYKYDMLIFYISGEFCNPCKILKPNLFNLLENNSNYEINLGIITYKTSEDMKTENSKEMNSYFNVKKIPYLVCCVNGNIIDSLQSSDINIVKPFLEKSFNLEFLENKSQDDFMSDDF